jgi:hypothetical protein
MIVQLPRFGTGVRSVFQGSPMSVPPVAGRLKMISRNLIAARNTTRRIVNASNQKAIRDAREINSLLSVKA